MGHGSRLNGCICWVFGLVMPLLAVAQNNPYKINDALYTLFQRANQYRTQPEGLQMADTLYNEAVRIGDKKAQCLAKAIPMYYHYYNRRSPEEFQKAVEELKTISRQNGYLQYYYLAGTNEINFLLIGGRSLAALQMAEELREQAFQDRNSYGIFSCIRAIANIYWERNDLPQAVTYYKEALDYMQEHMPEQDPSSIYTQLARYYRTTQDYSKAMEYADKGISEAKVPENRVAAMLEKCMLLWDMGDENRFATAYDACMLEVSRYGASQKETLEILHIYRLILDGQYAEAHEAADKINNKSVGLLLHESIYTKAGDYERAYIQQRRRWIYQDSIDSQMQADDLAELNTQVGLERMKLDAQGLALENAELNAKNATMELDRTRAQMEMERMNAENNQLQLHNQNLEYERLRLEAEQEATLLREQQVAAEHHIVVLTIVLISLGVFIAGLIFYLYKRRKLMNDLRHKNEELRVARDQAEQADKMKTYFIQNMSHEIRTPLNAIVGFSQLIFDPDMHLSDDERRQFGMLIQQNSDLLTTLINDILDLANLESGKYTMKLAMQSCNEVCRMAISTVTHRKPAEVELYFTTEVDDNYCIETDANRLRQVLINFLTNAEKYTEHGEIHLHCSLTERPGKVVFSVTDTGVGIPADKAETIFERFKKLDDFKQGTGLGLNICRLIADRLNGEVCLDKTHTHGARFLCIMPLRQPGTTSVL